MKWFSNGRISGKVWNILAKVRRETFLFTLSSITAHRGYNIPRNFSDRTMRVEGAAEFIRRDIFSPRETLSRDWQRRIENDYK